MSNEIKLKSAYKSTFVEEDSSWMALDVPEIKPPLYSMAFILFLSAFFVVGFFYSAVTTVPVSVETVGRLINEKPAMPVRAISNFTIGHIYVKENQIVKAHESLAELKEGLATADMRRLHDLYKEFQIISSKNNLIGCLECEQSLAKSSKILEGLAASQKIDGIIKPIYLSNKNLLAALIKMKEIDSKLSPYKTRLAKIQPAVTGGRGPASLLPKLKAEAVQLQDLMNQQYSPYVRNIQKLHTDYIQLSRGTAANLEGIVRQSTVKAPYAGKIINVRVKGGDEIVSKGQTLMEIVPLDNRLVAQVEVSNQDIGAISVGDKVDVLIDAFPEADFGSLKGEVEEVSSQDNIENIQNGRGNGFQVRVRLSAQELKSAQTSHQLLSGMTIKTRIRKKNETLLKILYRSVFRIKEDIRNRT